MYKSNKKTKEEQCNIILINNILTIDVFKGCEIVQKFNLSAMIDNEDDQQIMIGKEEDINFIINNKTGFTKLSQEDLENLIQEQISEYINTNYPKSAKILDTIIKSS